MKRKTNAQPPSPPALGSADFDPCDVCGGTDADFDGFCPQCELPMNVKHKHKQNRRTAIDERNSRLEIERLEQELATAKASRDDAQDKLKIAMDVANALAEQRDSGVDALVVECVAIDEDNDEKNIAVINDLPREWIGKTVRVMLKANDQAERRVPASAPAPGSRSQSGEEA
jgi:uncharacterized Zn finger protein (UPF0148 family)